MARQREFDKAEVVRLASDLFSEHGFESTSMGDLVAATGILAGSLHAAFGSKEGLYFETLGYYEEVLFSHYATPKRGMDALRYIIHQGVALASRGGPRYYGCPLITSVGVKKALSEKTLRRMTAISDRFVAMLRRHVDQALERGEFAADVSARDVTALLNALLYGMHALGIAGASRSELQAAARGAIGTLERGRR